MKSGTDGMMRAVRLLRPGGPNELVLEWIEKPTPLPGEVLVKVHAAAITRDELEWPLDRLPAIPSYELSGVVVALAENVDEVSVGDEVYALTPFDRNGAAAEYVAVSAGLLAPKPTSLDHILSAAIPLPALSAWQGLFDHGNLSDGQRVLIHGAAGGVGQFATQLAASRAAYVIGTTSSANSDRAYAFGAIEVVDYAADFETSIEPVDLVFDAAGGDLLERSTAVLRSGGRVVSVASEPPEGSDTMYFVVEPNREQLIELTKLVEGGTLRAEVDSVFSLEDAQMAFARSLEPDKRGKVVLRVSGAQPDQA